MASLGPNGLNWNPWWHIINRRLSQYLIIHALYTRIGVFRHQSNIPPRSSHSQIGKYTPKFCMITIFVIYFYTNGSWLLQLMSCSRLFGLLTAREKNNVKEDNWIDVNKLQSKVNEKAKVFIKENAFEIVVCQIRAILSWCQCLMLQSPLSIFCVTFLNYMEIR